MIVAEGLLIAATADGDLVMAEAAKDAYRELGRFPTGLDLKGNTQQMTLANGRLHLRVAVQRSMCPDRIANTEHKRDTGPDPSGKGPGRGSARQGVQGFGLISFFVQMLILSPCTDP
jgi:hypothetical protein